MRDFLAIITAKLTHFVSQLLKLGAGGTWPGEVAIRISPQILSRFVPQFKRGIIIVAGTNGKTTTSLMIKTILEATGQTVVHNASGANLLNGVVSACVPKANWLGVLDNDWGVFEVDENSLSMVVSSVPFGKLRAGNYQVSKKRLVIVLLNLFRDQLDRYGEVDVIVEKWEKALKLLASDSTLILNADDPGVVHIGRNLRKNGHSGERSDSRIQKKSGSWASQDDGNIVYFGINEKSKFLKTKEHATDSTFCLNCGGRLTYDGIYYSHIGIWKCEKCGQRRPQPDLTQWPQPLPGLYNLYNTLAAVATAKALGISEPMIKQALVHFRPAFGRQEEFAVEGPTSPDSVGIRGASKKIKLFLSKNPAGFNASLRTVLGLMKGRSRSCKKDSRLRGNDILLLVLNDRIPDGRDVSWIWDVDFEMIPQDVRVIVSGDRVYDMALRIKYSRDTVDATNLNIEPKLDKALIKSLKAVTSGGTVFVLPTYSAMLEVRKIISGHKIL